MSSTFGNVLRLSIFGQSHSPAVGCVVEGLPSGLHVDLEALTAFVARRAPGNDPWGTPRKEPDIPRIVSGLNPDGRTCGAPLAAVIENTNTRSRDYNNLLAVPRPGHADFTAWAKWHGEQDVPGGGHFSGRLTGPLCVAGGIALQWLASRGVGVRAHVAELAGIPDEPFSALDNSPASLDLLARQMAALGDGRRMPTVDEAAGARMVEAVMDARSRKDTLGGVVECVATGLPAGAGSPMFDGVENVMARPLFGIPAVKGVEFGEGFGAAALRGSQNNDPFTVAQGGAVRTTTNHAGGILGGITSGMPLVFRIAVKPTASISQPQQSVDLAEHHVTELEVHGRHDPCIVPRAVPCIESAAAIAVYDALLASRKEMR